MELESNQAALILEANDEGEISVNIATPDSENLAVAICQIVAQRLTQDEKFQSEIMEALESSVQE